MSAIRKSVGERFLLFWVLFWGGLGGIAGAIAAPFSHGFRLARRDVDGFIEKVDRESP